LVPKIHSLRRSDFDTGANEENSIGRESDHIVQSQFLDVDHLQDVTGLSTKQPCILDDEELLLLRGPEQPPRGREGPTGGDCILAENGHGVNGFDDGSASRRVLLGLEASVLVRDEAEEAALGGLGLGREGRAGDFRGGRVMEFRSVGGGNEDACGHGGMWMYGEN
jgi:hypothetical protein